MSAAGVHWQPALDSQHLAGRTTTLMLGTAVIVLPWHNPILVAEQILVFEAVSGGRGFYGLGRGRSEIEFAGLGVDRARARRRATPMDRRGLA